MALYEYEAIGPSGKRKKATIDADSFREAKIKLVERKISAITLKKIELKKEKATLKKEELLFLTKEISRLLYAGLPLHESLIALEEKYRSEKIHPMILDLTDQIRKGSSFSSALASYPKTFDLLYTSMIFNAEKTGSLRQTLDELAALIEKQLYIRKQLLTALLYPSLLLGFCLIVLTSLLLYVIPSLKELFDGKELHPFTQIVFAASDFFVVTKWFFLAAILSFITFAFWAKEKVKGFFYRLPKCKDLFCKIALVRFTRATSTLLEGGLSVVEAFSQARRVMSHPKLEKVIEQGEERIKQGEPIYHLFEKEPLIPSLVSRLISIAEKGGNLGFMMGQIAKIYEEELDQNLTRFAALAQPVLLLILGGIIGFVLLSVLLPMTDVSSFAT